MPDEEKLPPSRRPTREVDADEIRRQLARMMETIPPPVETP